MNCSSYTSTSMNYSSYTGPCHGEGKSFCDWRSSDIAPLFSSGQTENEKMRQMEEKIQTLTKNLQDLQSTINTMKEQSQQEVNRPVGEGGGGRRNPADAAQPEIKETIHSIQTKLDQLDNRTQVSVTVLWMELIEKQTNLNTDIN